MTPMTFYLKMPLGAKLKISSILQILFPTTILGFSALLKNNLASPRFIFGKKAHLLAAWRIEGRKCTYLIENDLASIKYSGSKSDSTAKTNSLSLRFS